ncbi:PIN-like domain-containing protein [Asanoa sp. WMMD1127]|uniref:PIN-like domain-containing protein n=1 Tax=Asanoa sp. WMMD1127 TaxID=3016107 RepID=UPI002417C21C|nr:PIN-like domain-containing protein [Asanoa sp. WMMD1127]MDG4823278.1 PIN-like domain-containing protein [Asanoa sp. WMMD1127]
MPGLFDGFEGYFIHGSPDVDRALTSALIAVDANVLLNLYRYNERTTEDLLTIFDKIGHRLVIPHQAMREFHRNRLAAIGNPAGAAQDLRNTLDRNQRSASDALARWAKQVALDDQELSRLQDGVGEAFDRLREAVDRGEPNRVRADSPAAEDRVLRRLEVLLDGRVLSCPSDEADLIVEGNRRVEAQVPPGYLDADKGDVNAEGAAGDFLVYRQACDEATQRGLDLVIITGDEKEDWWWRHRNVAIGPRHEMVKEFFDRSNGRRLFLLTPRSLLQRSGVLDVEVSPISVEDAARPLEDLQQDHGWTTEGIRELLRRLEMQGFPHAAVIWSAADLGGIIDRDTVYDICGYEESRTLRGFTTPVARITSELQGEGLVAERVTPMLVAVYPNDEKAAGFRIPDEVVSVLSNMQSNASSEATSMVGVTSWGKYLPLTAWLRAQSADDLPLSFGEIEEILGADLAGSARKHPPYWRSSTNSLGKAITAAGFKASRVDLDNETVRFVRRA